MYKVKKPVCLDGFDCRRLAQRRYLCDEELPLNRRLAPDVYLDVVALTLDDNDHFAVTGGGPPVDWLVKMRRLAANKMPISGWNSTAHHHVEC